MADTRDITDLAAALIGIDSLPKDGVLVRFMLVGRDGKPCDSWCVDPPHERVVGIKDVKLINGKFPAGVPLVPNDKLNGYTRYLCKVFADGVADFVFFLPTDDLSPISWAQLAANGTALVPAEMQGVYVQHSMAAAENDVLVGGGVGAWVKKTLAEFKAILGLGTAAYTDSTAYDAAGAATAGVNAHLAAFAHGDIAHANRAALDAVSGSNTGDQSLASLGAEAAGTAAAGDAAHLAAYAHGNIAHANRAALDLVSGTNTGDQTLAGLGGIGLYWQETLYNSGVNATIHVVSLKANSSSANVDAVFSPKGSGAILAHVPDGTAAGGNKRGAYSVDLQLARTAADKVVSGQYSFAAGYDNKVIGDYSVAFGRSNYINNAGSAVFGYANYLNATSDYCVVGGYGNTLSSSAYYSAVFGQNNTTYSGWGLIAGSGNSVSPSSSHYCIVGQNNSATGQFGCAFGASNVVGSNSVAFGFSNTVSGSCSMAVGRDASTNQLGKFVHACGKFASAGDAQRGETVLMNSSLDTGVILQAGGGTTGGASAQVYANLNQCIFFSGLLLGKQAGSNSVATYEIKGRLTNYNGNVVLDASSVAAIGADLIGLTAAPTLTLEPTYKTAAVTSGYKTGVAIKWVCRISTVEVTA